MNVAARKNNLLFFLKYAILFIIVFYLFYLLNSFEGYQHRWGRCLLYFKHGLLYQKQPFCFEGPVTYVLVYTLTLFTGVAHLQNTAIALNLVLNTVLLFLMYGILKHEKALHQFTLLLLLYIIWLFPKTVDMLESTIAMVFVLLSFYTLFYKRSSLHIMLSAVFASMAFYSKYTSIVPLGLSVIYTVLNPRPLDAANRTRRHAVPYFLATFTIISLLFLVNPNILFNMSTLWGSGERTWNLGDLTLVLLGLGEGNLMIPVVFLLVIISLYSHLKDRDVYSFVTCLGLTLTVAYFVLSNQHMYPHTYHYLPVFPFTLLFLILLNARYGSTQKWSFIIITLFLMMIYVDYSRIPLEMQVVEVRREVEGALSLIPKTSKNILIEGQVMKHHITRFLEGEPSFEVIEFGSQLDRGFNDKKYKGLVDASKIESLPEYSVYKEKIVQGDFDVMIYGPPSWETLLNIIYTTYSTEDNLFYCVFTLPNLAYVAQDGVHETTVMFPDYDVCNAFSKDLSNYYQIHFQNICKIDETVANNIVRNVLGANYIYLDIECVNGGSFISYYSKHRNNFTFGDLARFGLIVLIAFTYLEYKRKNKRIWLLITLTLTLLLLYSSLRGYTSIESSPWYSHYTVIKKITIKFISESELLQT